jgi:hypothetical protein
VGSSGAGGRDATTPEAGAGDAPTSSSGGPTDGSLDIAFPDSFYGPDTSGGGSDSGGEAAAGCSPNGITCKGTVAQKCSGGTLTTSDCAALPTPQTCANGYGCVVCQPGTGSCTGNVGQQCKADGSGYVTNQCDPQLGEGCSGTTGACTGDCATVGASYIGCEYYAVSMLNESLDQGTFSFSVVVSNTTTTTANLAITGPGAYSASYTLAGGGIQNYTLPWVPLLSTVNTTTMVAGGAYHIKSTEPVTVYQFNPYGYEVNAACSSDPNPSPPCRAYTNDASLLIPVNALTAQYRVVAGATWYFSGNGTQYPGSVDIIATTDGTQVTYAAPAGNPIQAGAGLSTAGGTATLNRGDVLQIAAAANATTGVFGSDQTGALVTATQPIEVTAGSDCTYLPATVAACDHLEEINFPLETLGSDYLVSLPYNANGTPRQFVKIVGTASGTTLTTNPAQAAAPATIGAGQVVVFETTQDFRLTASHPVAVGQFMESQYAFGSNCAKGGLAAPPDCGDPSESMAVATAQFRTSYQFIAPPSYYENWVNVIAPSGAAVTIDGAAVSGFALIGSSGFQVAHVALCGNTGACTGVHSASSTQPFGIQVYGYGYFTSYMYPGGLNLSRQ